MVTPSELLVRAADLIRDTAAAATRGPWSVNDQNYPEAVISAEGDYVVSGGRWGGEASVFDQDGDARWIALMSPAVAPMIEKWLRDTASFFDEFADYWVTIPEQARDALALARAVLGEKEEQ